MVRYVLMNYLAPSSSVRISAGAVRRADQLMLMRCVGWPTIDRARCTASLCPGVLSAYDQSGVLADSASIAVPSFADSACLQRP
jgi:hypothetical protein